MVVLFLSIEDVTALASISSGIRIVVSSATFIIFKRTCKTIVVSVCVRRRLNSLEKHDQDEAVLIT